MIETARGNMGLFVYTKTDIGGIKMVQNIIVVVLFAAMIGAGAFGWWLENGKDKTKEENAGENENNKA